jgi:hypothetical protein
MGHRGIYVRTAVAGYNGAKYAWAFYELPVNTTLNTAYTGPLFKARRNIDNAELDFYEGSSLGVYNTTRGGGGTDFVTWSGSSTGNASFLVTWYDQTGNGNHMTQTTNATQPIIYEFDTGGMVTIGTGGIMAMKQNGGNRMNLTTAISSRQNFSIVTGASRTSTGQWTIGLADPSNPVYSALEYSDGNVYLSDGSTYTSSALNTTAAKCLTSTRSGTTLGIRNNGSVLSVGATGSQGGGTTFTIYQYYVGGANGNNFQQVCIVLTDGTYTLADVENDVISTCGY